MLSPKLGADMQRRDFITLLGGAAAAWPLAVRAQQPTTPVVGFLNPTSADAFSFQIAAFQQGLRDFGYIDGKNIKIEYGWAEGQYDRLPPLAADFVRRQVNVIVASGADTAFAAKAATNTIPIVFDTGSDPVKVGLVASLARPGGNLTGVNRLSVELLPKRLELVAEVVPKASLIGLLVNPAARSAVKAVSDVESAAHDIGQKIKVLNAGSESEIESAFGAFSDMRADALLVATNQFFSSRAEKLAALAVHHAIPTVYQSREFAAAGGLIAYGSSDAEAFKLLGVYAGKVLKGAMPNELPVEQLSKVELIVNLRTAKALGLTVPPLLLARADEVIE
jgi:putative ABC transport system substrate-binding protein